MRSRKVSERDCLRDLTPSSLAQLLSSLACNALTPNDRPRPPPLRSFLLPADRNRSWDPFSNSNPSLLLVRMRGKCNRGGRFSIILTISVLAAAVFLLVL